MHNKTILVVDDDINLCQSIKIGFSKNGAKVIIATDGVMGIKRFFDHKPDLVILDIRLPEMDGWEVCNQIRKVSDTPIIMLTSLNQDIEIISGLKSGADDYVTKPFSRDVLAARATAVMRRVQQDIADNAQYNYSDENIQIDLDARSVVLNGSPVRLSGTEFKILYYLLRNPNQCVPYQALLEHVWGWEYRDERDYVHVYVSHLRKKLEEDPKHPRYLLNESGVGYLFCANKHAGV